MTQVQPDPFAKGDRVKHRYHAGTVVSYEGPKDVRVKFDDATDTFGVWAEYLTKEPVPAAGEQCAACGASGAKPCPGTVVYLLYSGQHKLCAACWNRPSRENDRDIARRNAGATPQPEQAKFIDDDGVTRFNLPEQAKVDPYAAERTGPYGGSDLTHEAYLAETQRAEDEMTGRRAALVVALKAEHAASSKRSGLLETFPRQGRNPR